MHADRSRTTLRGLVAGTVARNLAWAAAALASWTLVTALAGPVTAGQLSGPSGDPSGGPAAGPAMDRVAALVTRHDCWSEAAPADREPARAVVTLPQGRPRLVPATTGYRIWIEGDAGVLHAFCP